MTIPIGRKGQVFLKKEAAYGDEETITATDALRHIEIAFGFNPYNRITSPEKKQSPGPVNRFDRKKTAELGNLVALMRPSGVLGTVPEIDPLLEAALGSITNRVADDTTLTATPTVTTGTVAAAGTLAKGDAILIGTSHADSPFVRILTDVSGDDLTWAPALPAAPIAADTVKGGITYKLTTDLAISLTIAHYVGALKRELLGVGIDQLTIAIDANEEPRITAAGPAAEQLSGTTQAQPASFTSVGGNPPSGLVGELLIDDVTYLFKTLEVALTNALLVRNQEYGVNTPTEVYRQGRREITLSLEAFAETEATLYDKAEAGSNVTLLKQTGRTEGNIVALYCPRVEFTVPEQDDPDEEINWSFTGVALESADGENDEFSIAIM